MKEYINYKGGFKIIINNQNQFQSLILDLKNSCPLNQQKQLTHANNDKEDLYLEIAYQLSLFSQLTPLKKQQQLCRLSINDLIIQTTVGCSTKYDFDRMAYWCQLKSSCYSIFQRLNRFDAQIQIKETFQNQNISKHSVRLLFSVKKLIQTKDLVQNNKYGFVSAFFGQQKKQSCDFSIGNLQFTIKQLKQNQHSFTHGSKICNYSLGDLSYPLHQFDPLILKEVDVQYFQKLINQLPHYSSIKIQEQERKQQLYICHDMKGGYIQDVNFDHPYRYNRSHSYRYLNLHHTKIFNYFSHYTISVPPQHWRLLCQKYKVKCLGTFIIQNKLVSENVYLTQEFAMMLVYIAKKCRFDGYLINIEFQVKNVQKLKHWLQFLTNQTHKHIPNSLIIWYDSVISTSGNVVHQNQINSLNQIFYQISDGFFTNYWWKDNHLQNTLKNIQSLKIPNKQVFIGNDCFGRGTFGGGKYQIYKAITKILQIGQTQLNVSLFAPGFTLQDNAEQSRTLHRLNQDKLFHGLQSNLIKLQNVNKHVNRGQGWKYQGDWAVTSHDWCDRQFLLNLKEYKGNQGSLLIKFMVIIAGTGPKFNDPYKLIMQVYDQQFNLVYVQTDPSIKEATQIDQQIEISLQVDCQILTDTTYLKIIQSGKDAQKWAGNYGVRFRNQLVLFIKQAKNKNWIQKIPITSIDVQKHYQSFCNVGEGDYFYFFGQKTIKNYDYLVDYDIGHIMSLNNIANVSIYDSDAYMGGSSILVRNDHVKLLKLDISKNSKNGDLHYYIKIVHKNTQIKTVLIQDVLNQKNKIPLELVMNEKVKHSDWFKSIYQMKSFKVGQFENSYLAAYITAGASLFGQISIFSSPLQLQNINQCYIKPKFRLNVSLSQNRFSILPYYVDIQLTQLQKGINFMSNTERYLLKIGDFNGFIYLLNGFGRLRSIPICSDVSHQLKIELIDVCSIKPIILMQQSLVADKLKQFIFSQSLIVQN